MCTIATNPSFLDMQCVASSGMQFSVSHQLHSRESGVTNSRRLEEEKNKGFSDLSHHYHSDIL